MQVPPLKTSIALGVALLTVMTTSLAALPASASQAVPPSNEPASRIQADVDALYAGVDPRTKVFDAAVAIDHGAPQNEVQDFAATWLVRGSGPVENIEISASELRSVEQLLGPLPRACSGKERWDHTGLQYNFYFNSCSARSLQNAYNTGGASAGFLTAIFAAIGFVPGAAGSGIIAAMLGLAGAVIGNCNSAGRGIVVHAIPPAAWCNGQ